jgi:hypothetical protein
METPFYFDPSWNISLLDTTKGIFIFWHILQLTSI